MIQCVSETSNVSAVTVTASRCVFDSNQAVGLGSGGGLFVNIDASESVHGVAVVVTDCAFGWNQASGTARHVF